MTTLMEIPGVSSAVEHLQDLGARMQHDFGFAENDVENIDRIVEALKELEIYRRDAHERLEAETIRASILRHKLQFLPDTIRKEISDAVSSARQSNADDISALKDKLESINKNIIVLEESQKKLDEENSTLHPERELIRQQHEEIISQLNQRMAEKASMQIHLNETRDKVRQTNQEIVDLEDGILQLKEDLIQERGEARNEKRQLKKAVASTSEKTKEQKLLNVEKKRDLDSLHEKLVDSEGKLDALRKSLRRYETSKAKLEGQERALTAQLTKQLKQNEELRKKGISIVNEDARLEKEFEENQTQLRNKLHRMETEIEYESSQFEDFAQQRDELIEELEEKLEVGRQDAERVAGLDGQLQTEKRNLAMKAEDVGRMQGENVDMHEQIEQLGESHKAMQTELDHRAGMRTPSPPGLTEEQKAMLDELEEEERAAVLAQLNKQIEDYRAQLAQERKERMEVQQRKNSVAKELEDYKVDNQRFMQDMNSTITSGKQEHISLSNEIEEESEPLDPDVADGGASLQKQLKEDDNEINKLETQLEAEQKQYQDSFKKLQNQYDLMEREVIEMENNIAEKAKQIEDYTPGFEELEKQFEDRTDAYEKQKKNIVELKTKKTALEEQLRKARIQKENMHVPQEKLRNDLKQKRHEAMFQLKHHGEEVKQVESEIYVSGCKLKTVMDENYKLDEGCKQLTTDIDQLQNDMDYNELLKKKLLMALMETKAALETSWDGDNQIQQKFGERDQVVVDELGDLVDRTKKREEKISDITSHLEIELGHLTRFLDKLATRRPQDSRDGRRPLSQEGRLSRSSGRSLQTPLEAVVEANRIESRKSSARVSRPPTSKSNRSVVIAEEVTELSSNNRLVKSVTKKE